MGAPSGKVPYTSSIPGAKTHAKGAEPFKNPSIFYWDKFFYMFVNEEDNQQQASNHPNETQNYVTLFTNTQPNNSTSNWTLSNIISYS